MKKSSFRAGNRKKRVQHFLSAETRRKKSGMPEERLKKPATC
jgi:hypothetical protein